MRSMLRKTGHTPVTRLDRLYDSGGRSFSGAGDAQGGKIEYNFTTSDYVADATFPPAAYRIDVEHNLLHRRYDWNVHKDEDSRAINVIEWIKGDSTLELFFVTNSKDITVVVDP